MASERPFSTLHSAKGLEFETVFIAGAADSIIPHERSKTDAELEEERRLLYVGVTRAMNALYISFPKTRYDKEMKDFKVYRIRCDGTMYEEIVIS